LSTEHGRLLDIVDVDEGRDEDATVIVIDRALCDEVVDSGVGQEHQIRFGGELSDGLSALAGT
jgi:hypothetical protein